VGCFTNAERVFQVQRERLVVEPLATLAPGLQDLAFATE
jgi:hypothetical protein